MNVSKRLPYMIKTLKILFVKSLYLQNKRKFKFSD